LRERGWTKTIGIEIKRSGADIGPAISQAIDYTYCTWHVRGADVWLYCERIFLRPFRMPGGPAQSVMLQNGIGTIWETGGVDRTWFKPLIFSLERQVIAIDENFRIETCEPTTASRKVGSR